MAETNETGPTGYPRWVREQLPVAASGHFAPTVIAGLLDAAGARTQSKPPHIVWNRSPSAHRGPFVSR
jgi:hypothetical protein